MGHTHIQHIICVYYADTKTYSSLVVIISEILFGTEENPFKCFICVDVVG